MVGLIWLRGLLARRRGRLVATAAGVAVAVALLASLGVFLSASKASMTHRAVGDVAVDWQVESQPGTDPATVIAAVGSDPGVVDALPVTLADTTGLTTVTGTSTQTTGGGVVVGLPDGYRDVFPGQLRTLAGTDTGVLLAQQTAANLHAAPGGTVTIGRAGLPPVDVTVTGIVDPVQADSLFQAVGAPVGAQPQAPPDNVVFLPSGDFARLMEPLATVSPTLVRTQVHARLDHHLPADPAAAYTAVTGHARNLEARLAGGALVGDNLAATLGAARADALYAQVLFVFLGLPGAVLAALLTAGIAGAGADRRRHEQALLRTRGATTRRLVQLGLLEAGLVGGLGALVGLGAAAAIGAAAFGSARFGASTASAVGWAAGAAGAGLAIAAVTVALPAWRDATSTTVTAARRTVRRADRPRGGVRRHGLALASLGALAASGLVFWLTSRGGYALVLAPEGVPTISVSYWAFAGPALLWIGLGLGAWSLGELLLDRGRPLVARAARVFGGSLGGSVAAVLSRQRRLLARAAALVCLTAAFAASTATFNATYRQQAEVDAKLTNGADVTVTESPGVAVGPAAADELSSVPGVRGVEPLQHRYAYVGADLQDLYGVRTATVASATSLQDAYFAGGTATELMGALGRKPDSVLVSLETVHDFQLELGDPLTLRLQDGRTKDYVDVPFHYAGVAKEFPTAPSDSFVVANADYVAQRTGSDAVGTFLVDTGGHDTAAVAGRIRHLVGTDAQVTDITSSRRIIGSSLTSVDLAGLTKVELGLALGLAVAATGLSLALGLAERRRSFTVLTALGARPRQLALFVWAEAVVVGLGGLAAGAIGGWALSSMLVKVLTGVFDPPPAHLAVPVGYLATVAATAAAATVAAGRWTLHATRRPDLSTLRDL
ncbi:MAG TPA: FtsX-like permease family protein [Acidimicrobiales bacterium]|nr:FtsX-like permease family protein [Acidimicrobiales bacterium]